MKCNLTDKEIVEDFYRFVRHEAMRANIMEDHVRELVINEIRKGDV